ncbi:MAG: cupin domain-containing protein [bacterium]
MKIVKIENATEVENSATSHLLEYSVALNDKDIDLAVNTIVGRYPENGYCTNKECKELVYVLAGTGTLNKHDQCLDFKAGDVLLIEQDEVYFWKGNCKIIMVCTPPWHKEQCKFIKEIE